jgi:hypothetical protein
MRLYPILNYFLFGCLSLAAACGSNVLQQKNDASASMRDVAAVRLNYRYEPDVPAPALDGMQRSDADRNAGVQADFDNNRRMELLDRTISSPDKKRVLAVYRSVNDLPSEVRLDMYSSDGKLLRKVTSDTMAAHFPDTIVWSPDSRTVAFVAANRTVGIMPAATPTPDTAPSPPDPNADPAESTPTPKPQPAAPTPAAPIGILTFKTEQIYICDSDAAGIKALTQTEGLIYFYYVWSPDSTMLAALAATAHDWTLQERLADTKGELMVPQGRLRIVEKNGRERRLEDNPTAVHPVWSPDSAKVAVGFETQIRVYDAGGTNPTQAAIPLKNQLLISSQAYDLDQKRKLLASNSGPDAPSDIQPTPEQPSSTLPNEKDLVSYNPIVEIAWTADDLIYLKTAYVRRMKNDADSVMSFTRWHRLALTPQAAPAVK